MDMKNYRDRGKMVGLSGTCLCIFLLMVILSPTAQSSESPKEVLKLAWEEYGLQSYETSKRLFEQVISSSNADFEQNLQARIGKAFVIHYRMPGGDPVKALALYRGILKDLPEKHRMQGLVNARIGQCLLEKSSPEIKKGREHLLKAIEDENCQMIVRRDSVLRYVASFLADATTDNYNRALEASNKMMPVVKGTKFASSLYGIQSDIYKRLGKRKERRDAIIKQVESGINNPFKKASALFTIARMSDVIFKDYDMAKKYFDLLAKECPTDAKTYYAKLRAEEIGKGILESRIDPATRIKSTGGKKRRKPKSVGNSDKGGE